MFHWNLTLRQSRSLFSTFDCLTEGLLGGCSSVYLPGEAEEMS